MSASSKKKLRNEQNAALLTEKQKKEQQEAKKLKVLTLTFTVVMVLVVAILIGVTVTPSIEGMVRRNSHAVTIGDHELSAAELTYFYIDAISDYQTSVYQSYYSYYGDYWYLALGFSTSAPLNAQEYDEETGETWADYFMDMAIENATSVYALYDDAMSNNYTLSEEDQETLDNALNSLESNAKSMNYNNLRHYLRSIYGTSAKVKSYKEYYTLSAIASAYYNDHSESLSDAYTLNDFREHDKDKFNDYTNFSFVYYTLNYSSYLKTEDGVKDDTGTLTWTDEQKNAARAQAKADMEALLNAGITDKETFDKAVQALEINMYDKDGKPVEDSKKATATQVTDRIYTSITIDESAKEWLAHADRQPGDLTSVPVYAYVTDSETVPEDHVHGADCGHEQLTNSYYVVLYLDKDTNEAPLANVRHILVKFQGGKTDSSTGKVTYTAAEKEAAKAEAEKLLADWKASIEGETDAAKIEESFGELANKESDDLNGKVTNGGLYEDIYPGMMVESFEDWCLDESRKAGDTGIVETEYGYHVMFYSSADEMSYRDLMIRDELLTEDMEEWHDGLTEAMKVTVISLKYLEQDLIVG